MKFFTILITGICWAGISGLSETHLKEEDRASCPTDDDWVTWNDRCYLFRLDEDEDHRSWHDALRECKGYNDGKSSLVTIHTADENNFIYSTAINKMEGKMHVWIGMSKRQHGFPYLWEDGSSVNYVNWESGEPNDYDGTEKCVRMWDSTGTWDDYACKGWSNSAEEKHGYVCQWEPASDGSPGCQSIPADGYPGCCTTGDVFAIIFGIIILLGIVVGVLGYLYVFRWNKALPWQKSTGAPSSFDNPAADKH